MVINTIFYGKSSCQKAENAQGAEILRYKKILQINKVHNLKLHMFDGNRKQNLTHRSDEYISGLSTR